MFSRVRLACSVCLLWQIVLVHGFVVPKSLSPQTIVKTLQDSRRTIHQTSLSTNPCHGLMAATNPSLPPDHNLEQLSPLEDWCAREVEEWYQRATSVKCPFFKRRFVDILDGVDMILRFLVIRHKSLDIFGPPPGHRSKFSSEDKRVGLTIHQLADAIRKDWKEETGKGYYITGNLNTTIFRDDCLFAGPDPDMPVKGLRKYLNAASQLFDRSKSRAELLSLDTTLDADGNAVVVVRWRMNGVLRLPWKPTLPEWTGSTTYHFDQDGLIYLHEETWDMSALQAFMETFAPSWAKRIYYPANP